MAIVAGAAAAAVASTPLIGAGVAAAGPPPDVVGKPYSDAKTALSDASYTPVVATVVGDKLPQSDCYVVSTS